MKHKNAMAKLGRKMVIWFLVITFCAGMLSNLIEGISDLAAPYIQQSESDVLLVAAALCLLFSSAMIYVISGVVFFLLTKKAIKKESERQIQEKDLIYAAVAHDLKTPMTSVQGFARALADGKVRPEEQQEALELICRKSETMNDMINTLFEYAKLGTEEYKPHLAEVNICSLVRETAAENYCDFEEHSIDLDVDIPDEAIMISADRTELKRALTNLIVNIYKHNPDGIKAKISVTAESGKAFVRIADSGAPLPDDTDIFEPFVTENTARTIGHGSGLGLAVARRVIERHGGTISIGPALEGYTKMFVICMTRTE